MRTFSELSGKFFELYGQASYADALALVQASQASFPDHRTEMITWEVCMQSRLGCPGEAIQTLSDAIHNSTYWWNSSALRNDPDLAPLQGNPEYDRLVAICDDRARAAKRDSRPERLVFAPPVVEGERYPLLISFHGWGQNARMDAPHWQALAGRGWLVAITGSSQMIADGMRVWDDHDRAVSEALSHYEVLCREYPVDPERIVLAGFSQGGGLALWLAVSQTIPGRGFIGVGPYLDDFDTLMPAITPHSSALRIQLVTGAEEKDEGMFAQIEELCVQRNIPFQQEIVPALGHDYPANFKPMLQRAFTFIFENEEG
jgi:predicted esterase